MKLSYFNTINKSKTMKVSFAKGEALVKGIFKELLLLEKEIIK